MNIYVSQALTKTPKVKCNRALSAKRRQIFFVDILKIAGNNFFNWGL